MKDITKKKLKYITIAFFVVILFWTGYHFTGYLILHDLFIGLITNLVVLTYAIFVIEKLIDDDRDKNLRHIQSVAYKSLYSVMNEVCYLFAEMYKSTLNERPKNVTKEVETLFTKEMAVTICNLDFSKEAPRYLEKSHKMIWVELIYNTINNSNNEVNQTILKYALYLTPEDFELLEKIVNHEFFKSIQSAVGTSRIDRSYGYTRDNRWLKHALNENSVKEYISLLKDLCTKVNFHSGDMKIRVSENIWSDIVAPKYGSGL